jgi:hypothetical protein
MNEVYDSKPVRSAINPNADQSIRAETQAVETLVYALGHDEVKEERA